MAVYEVEDARWETFYISQIINGGKDILFSFSRLATWKQQLVGGDQTHDGLDDCRDLKEIIGRIAGDEDRDMADVVRAGAISQEYD